MALQDDINNFTSSCIAADLINLAAQTSCTTTNRMIYVNTVNDLPDLTNNSVTPGTVFFVNSLSIPVVAQVGCWTGLDNRELRSDCLLNLAYTWGSNNCGRLGTNETPALTKSSPVSVVGGFNDWSFIDVGSGHKIGLRNNGTIWTWGSQISGVLGDGTGIPRSSPVRVVGGFTDWCQVSAGSDFNLAVRANGTAWGWGEAFPGRLGNNCPDDRSSPVSVVGGFTDWCQVAAGAAHGLGLRSNCTIWAWGCGDNGALGENTNCSSRSSPVSVVGGFTDWCRIAAGSQFSLALRTNGTIWAWGSNSNGQLGDNSAISRSSPVSVVNGFTDWCMIDAGTASSIAIRTNGTLWTWGRNNNGILGTNEADAISRSSPVSVVGGFTDWCQASIGSFHASAVRTNGTAWSWGCNNDGQLGDGTTISRSSPVSIVGNFTWSSVIVCGSDGVGIRYC
jgi:alpha-tubulin suppressor-like RCC1 family protein